LPNAAEPRLFSDTVKFASSQAALLCTVLLPFLCAGPAAGADLNSLVLSQIEAMPLGGRYAVNHIATLRLQEAANTESGKFCVLPDSASPSFCSGATYLVFLKTIEALHRKGKLELTPSVFSTLLVNGQPDGVGVWGRWNANGPGTARLFQQTGLGHNFDDFDRARPGDFMKIFWTREVGKREHGHSVIYLGREDVGGVEYVRFWSSNMPAGYGTKSVPRSSISYAVFSRLEHPEVLARADLEGRDAWLAGLTTQRSSVREVRDKTGM